MPIGSQIEAILVARNGERLDLAPSPICQLRQGGFHDERDAAVFTANLAENASPP
jgi:hypothetical protein